jgi:hypothetical protein
MGSGFERFEVRGFDRFDGFDGFDGFDEFERFGSTRSTGSNDPGRLMDPGPLFRLGCDP